MRTGQTATNFFGGWVVRQRNPTNHRKCWVSGPLICAWHFFIKPLNPTYAFCGKARNYCPVQSHRRRCTPARPQPIFSEVGLCDSETQQTTEMLGFGATDMRPAFFHKDPQPNLRHYPTQTYYLVKRAIKSACWGNRQVRSAR